MRSRMLVVSIAIHLLAGLSASAAVTGRIEGRVARAEGTGLVAVEVVVEGTGLRTVTEANGRFVIAGVPAGTCASCSRSAPTPRAATR